MDRKNRESAVKEAKQAAQDIHNKKVNNNEEEKIKVERQEEY